MVAPEFLAVSDWERHAVVADLRGSFTGYSNQMPAIVDGTISPAPTDVDRPNFIGHVDGRLDVTARSPPDRAERGCWSPPTIPAARTSRPASRAIRSTPRSAAPSASTRISIAWISLPAPPSTAPPTRNQSSPTAPSSSNDDRNFNQYGGIGRVSYELTPGVKPFAEVEGDTRVHDLALDRNGFARDSNGGYAKAGTSFEFSRLLTGELSIGYAARNYIDPGLDRLQALLTSASLVWTATPLTTAKFFSDTQIAETTLPGTSGVLVHTYAFEVDHDFRRWLTAIGKFTYGTLDYQGDGRQRQDLLDRGRPGLQDDPQPVAQGHAAAGYSGFQRAARSSTSTVVMLGVRLQN